MTRFFGRLILEPLPMRYGKRWWRLVEPLGYLSDVLGGHVEVPDGFETDMASVPVPLQPLLQKDDGILWPAIVHDFLYSRDCPLAVTRREADLVFLEAMTHCGVGRIKRGLAYNAVRMFAGHSWRKR